MDLRKKMLDCAKSKDDLVARYQGREIRQTFKAASIINLLKVPIL